MRAYTHITRLEIISKQISMIFMMLSICLVIKADFALDKKQQEFLHDLINNRSKEFFKIINSNITDATKKFIIQFETSQILI